MTQVWRMNALTTRKSAKPAASDFTQSHAQRPRDCFGAFSETGAFFSIFSICSGCWLFLFGMAQNLRKTDRQLKIRLLIVHGQSSNVPPCQKRLISQRALESSELVRYKKENLFSSSPRLFVKYLLELPMPTSIDRQPLKAPRGSQLSCKGWQQEAALRMLMNNLDLEVAERPEDLVVYGGTGRAARSWEAFDAIVRSLRELENDETLLVQSGKPVAVFRTHAHAPRVLIANSNLVPRWATPEYFRELEADGLIMYGQMTAGSWIYIGTQGILQGTYETFGALARKHFGGSLRGRWVLTGGMGGMGGAQPLAATMNEAVILVIEVDPQRIERRLETRYCDRMTFDLPQALDWIQDATATGKALSVGLVANCAEVLPELYRRGIVPDVVTDQTSAHDELNGYVPTGLSLAAAADLRASDPNEYIRRSLASMRIHCEAMVALMR